ncbi:hypothetical protein [Lactobacillus sp. Sy-1]|uniref:hypothetical protein n=1 Tax=Lactobacillus sp. Sy-1 TaxID=2109645 RepID=UPI001C5AB8BD|nr:hypothetical protein [Lactobacillus sp. Sy-1]MBW1606358.1 hypothetical protein [Lactobacillus sp. Sy-1]
MENHKINKYIGNDKPLEIYSKSRDQYKYENFALGFIVKDLGPYLILQTIDDYGFLDSYTVMLKSDISKISFGTTYSKLFDRYVEFTKESHLYDPFKLKEQYKQFKTDDFLTLLADCFAHEAAVSIYTTAHDYVQQGRILLIKDGLITLNEVEYSELNGFNDVDENEPIPIEKITAMDILSKENFLFDRFS